jgi:hypothetical protein
VLVGLSSGRASSGTVSSGTVYAGYAPSGSLELTEQGRSVAREPAFGWAAQFPRARAGTATLTVQHAPYIPLAVLLEVLVWVALVVALVGRPRAREASSGERTEP